MPRPIRALPFLFLLAGPAYAGRLPTVVTPDHYDLAFTVDIAHARFEGVETIRVRVAEPTPAIVLHAAELQFRDVTIGTGASAQHANVTLDEAAETATFTVPKPLARGSVAIHIRYGGILNDKLRGFYVSAGAHRKYAVTQFESTDARRAFPCFDEPAFKATFAVTLTIDRGDTAISNGRLVSDRPGPAATQHTVKFSTTPRMSSYLVAMAVGDFECAGGATDGTPIRICATPDKKHLTQIALESAERILKFYNQYYDIKYPFGKLDVLAVPDFAAGAMENTAAIFYRETDLLADTKDASLATRKNIASVLAHEMAHQWFGDLVTMQWWDDIWLNEGFATWMANRPLAAWKPEWNIAVDEELETQKALNVDSLTSTRPIHAAVESPAEIDAAFDTIAYEKGAAVLRMIEGYVGRETFRKGVNAYLKAHAYANARSEDFWNAIASSSGKPVDRIMSSFVNQPGAPLVEVSLVCTSGQTAVTLAERRFLVDPAQLAQPSAEIWRVPFCVKTSRAPHATCNLLANDRQSMTLPGSCVPWMFANAGAQGYYRTAYPPDVLRALAPNVEAGLSAPERLSLVDDEWALVRATRHSAADYLTLATGYASEHVSGVLDEVAGQFAFIHEYLTAGPVRERFEAFARSLVAPLFAEVGFSPAPSDTDERRALRAVVVETLGTTGNDGDVAVRSRRALEAALAGGPPLEPTLAGAVIRVAAEHGDARLYDMLMAAAERAVSPDERYRYYYAAAKFRDPDVVDRGLQRVLSPEMRNQDASLYLSQFFGNPVARPRAWAFAKAHWAAIEPKITIFGGDVGLTRALGSFCDAASRDDIRAFFAAHPLPGAARELSLTFERIANCIDLADKQSRVVSDWLTVNLPR